MGERIVITCEVEKENLLNMFKQGDIAKAFEELLYKYFFDYITMHTKIIMRTFPEKMQEREADKFAFGYVKSCIEKKDMEMIQIEVSKELVREILSNKEEPKTAIYKVFEKVKIKETLEIIRRNLRNKYWLSSL